MQQHQGQLHLPVGTHDRFDVDDIHHALALPGLPWIKSAGWVRSALAALRAMYYEHMAGTLWFHPVAQHILFRLHCYLQTLQCTFADTGIQYANIIDQLTRLNRHCFLCTDERARNEALLPLLVVTVVFRQLVNKELHQTTIQSAL